MSSSTDTTNIDKHLLSTPPTYHEHSQSHRMQLAAMQKWLKQSPHEDPWSRTVEKRPLPDAQEPSKQQEQDASTDLSHVIQSNSSSSAGMTTTDGTDEALQCARSIFHEQFDQREHYPPTSQKWLGERPHAEPRSRTVEKCPLPEAQRPMKQQEPVVKCGLDHDIESNGSSSEGETTTTDELLPSAHPTIHEHSHSREHFPSATQKWLEERPHEEPWTRTVGKCPLPEAQEPLDQQGQANAQGPHHETDGNKSPSAGMTNTDGPLSSTYPTVHGDDKPCELDHLLIQKWLQETPHEEPWSTSSRPTKQCFSDEVQGVLEKLSQDMALDTTRR